MSTPDQAELELIRRLIPIAGLEPRIQDEVAAQGRISEVKRGEILFKKGDRDRDAVYLIEGEIELRAADEAPQRLSASHLNARSPLSPSLPRRVTARARTRGKVFQIERAQLDRALTDDQLDDGAEVQVSELDQAEDGDWMSRLLGSPLFTRLPPDHIQRFFAELEPLPASQDEVVVQQGTPGEHLFILADGRCEVVRSASGEAQEVRLAELHAGAVFGEEALISNAPRNATVRMLTAGLLMRLPKASFDELVRKPTLRAIAYSDAEELIQGGARWLDVRYPDEHGSLAIGGSLNIALNVLRLHLHKLERDVRYVVYCDTGSRSASGAFLLTQNGFDAVYLAGGLDHSPHSTREERPPRPAPNLTLVPDVTDDEDVPTVRDDPVPVHGSPSALELEADLAATRARLESVETRLAEAEQARVAQAAESASQLGSARDQLEVERQRANETLAAARRLQAQLQEARRLLESEREQRTAVEATLADARESAQRQESTGRRQLEGALGQSRRELENVIRAREQTEKWANEERARLTARSESAERRLADLETACQEAQSARQAAESALGDALRERQADLERQGERDEEAERALGALRAKVQQAQLTAEAELRRKQEIEQVAREADRRLHVEQERLAMERSRYEADLEALAARERELEERLAGEEGALARTAKANEEQAAALARQREALEAQATESAEAAERQRAELASGEAALQAAREALSQEVEQRVAAQRAELEARYEENVARAVKLARRTAEADAVGRVTKLKAVYERRLSEQAALIEDERRRSERELARLREALDAASRSDLPKLSEPVVEPERPVAAVAAGTHRPEPPFADRVLSAHQIADIRRRMEEKLRAMQQPGRRPTSGSADSR